jgi:glycosyltransferase involved in cell wall biosynthesis
MKILLFSQVVWNFYRGRRHETTLMLSKSGNHCVYVNPVRYKNWEKSSIRLHNVSKNEIHKNMTVIERNIKLRKSFLVLIYENINNVRYIKKEKPALVISFDHLMSLAPCIYCKLKKIKFIFDVTDNWERVETSKLRALYWKLIAKPIIGLLSYAVTSTSHKQAKSFKKYNSSVYIIPNGKSNEFIAETQKYINKKCENKVNFVANLRDWYDFDLLFDVFNEFPDLQLNIYGKGDLYNYLLVQSKQYDNINILGNIESKYIPKLMAESLFGILPLKSGKINDSICPIKLFDYWAAKKVIVGYPTYELKIIGKDCLMFARNKEEYIKNIQLILNNDKLRNDLGETGYQKIKNIYNYDKIIVNFEEIIS